MQKRRSSGICITQSQCVFYQKVENGGPQGSFIVANSELIEIAANVEVLEDRNRKKQTKSEKKKIRGKGMSTRLSIKFMFRCRMRIDQKISLIRLSWEINLPSRPSFAWHKSLIVLEARR